ncbi:AGE family epimerase/isomerase [candidate division KSB1 bacterium]|nr:AGE family epimerase/isomerase [candidate division KSB1 bacterium]
MCLACSSSVKKMDETLIQEINKSLTSELLNVWYPTTIDSTYGGFLSDFTYDWRPDGRQNKMIVTQTRHVWTCANAALFFKDDRYRSIAEHGFNFLKTKMWDDTYGGFYTYRNQQGLPIEQPFTDGKMAYGNAFAIYALAAYFELTDDSTALSLAKDTFYWLEKHSHDPVEKGYMNDMSRDGTWLSNLPSVPKNPRYRPIHWKDQNSSIHLLEAFSELYRVWPDSLLHERLVEMLTLIRDRIVTEKGYLTLFMEKDWTPVSFAGSSEAERQATFYFDHISFGHDVETAYLMLEACHVLGQHSESKTLTIAKKMVDHALKYGWDKTYGGFFDGGYYPEKSDSVVIVNDAKVWWVQADGLNALLLMSKLFPKEQRYRQAFLAQWDYINQQLIDHVFGGWYYEGLDITPNARKAPKASDWKVNYHNTRALMNCIKMLRSEHELIQ